MGQQALAVKHLPGSHDCMNFVSPASSRNDPLYGHSKRGGQLKLNGCAKGFRLCTPKFFRACENLWPMQSQIAVRYGRCGSGPVSWIAKTCFGLNLPAQSKSIPVRQRMLPFS